MNAISSRFLVWPKPLSYPFYDLLNRDTNPGPVFDLAVELNDYTGSVYLSVNSVIEMARVLGMATTDEVSALNAHIASLESQISKLPQAQEELKNGLASLVGKFHRDLLTDDLVVPVVVQEPESLDKLFEDAEREAIGPAGL